MDFWNFAIALRKMNCVSCENVIFSRSQFRKFAMNCVSCEVAIFLQSQFTISKIRNSFYNPDLDLETRLIFTVEFEFSICGSLLPDYWWVNCLESLVRFEFLSQFFVCWAWWWVELACERTFLRFIEHWTVEIMDGRTVPDFGPDSNMFRYVVQALVRKNPTGRIFSSVQSVKKIS